MRFFKTIFCFDVVEASSVASPGGGPAATLPHECVDDKFPGAWETLSNQFWNDLAADLRELLEAAAVKISQLVVVEA